MSAFKTWLYSFHSVKGPVAFMLGPLSRKLTGTEMSGALKDAFYNVGFFISYAAVYIYAIFYAKNAQEVLTAYCVAFACGSAVQKVLEKMSWQYTPSITGYLFRFIMLFAVGIALNLTFFWLTKTYYGYYSWYMLLIGLGILLLTIIICKLADKTESKVAQTGGIVLGYIAGIIGSVIISVSVFFMVLLLGVCINLLPLFGIVWVGSFFMESLKDHVMYWPNFWGSF